MQFCSLPVDNLNQYLECKLGLQFMNILYTIKWKKIFISNIYYVVIVFCFILSDLGVKFCIPQKKNTFRKMWYIHFIKKISAWDLIMHITETRYLSCILISRLKWISLKKWVVYWDYSEEILIPFRKKSYLKKLVNLTTRNNWRNLPNLYWRFLWSDKIQVFHLQ